MTATIETGCQTKGPTTSQFLHCFYHISKRAADDFVLRSLGDRVAELAFLWRVDGKFGSFEGDDVENVKIGRQREYISVDWLIRIPDWQRRNIHEVTAMLCRRLAASPPVIAAACRKRSVKVDEPLLASELTEYGARMTALAAKFDPMTRFIPPPERERPEWFCQPPPLAGWGPSAAS